MIVSNHKDFCRLAASYDIPFHHLPITAETKLAQEAKLMELVEQERIDLIVLARYMQVLSDGLCQKMSGRVINIHHSFLPSFKGARPYHQAQARGVKLIGATAHYVTADLDEGRSSSKTSYALITPSRPSNSRRSDGMSRRRY